MLRKICLTQLLFLFYFLYDVNVNFTFLFVKATICSTLANLEGEESFEALMLGQAEEVIQERICDDELILIKK